ncbi:MAG: hypothetical protein GC161_06610 [Planctomycetaceae bacterium]|nr:hypothetical protein [Planctomycetaceae bacterium]
MRLLALLASIVAFGCAERPPVDLAAATWNELVQQLPEPADEGRYDPTREEWVYHPAVTEFATRLARGDRPSDIEWLDALQRSDALRWREVWPVDVPWTVSMRLPYWLGHARIELHPRAEGFEMAEVGTLDFPICGFSSQYLEGLAAHQVLGEIRLGDQELGFDARVYWAYAPYVMYFPLASETDSVTDWEGRVTLPVRGVASLAEALPPASGPAVNAAVRRAVSVSVANNNLRLVYSPDEDPILRGLGVALELEVRQDGKLLERLDFGTLTSSSVLDGEADSRAHQERAISPDLLPLLRARSALQLTARGWLDPELLFDWNSDRHFAGSFELSLP